MTIREYIESSKPRVNRAADTDALGEMWHATSVPMKGLCDDGWPDSMICTSLRCVQNFAPRPGWRLSSHGGQMDH